MFDNLFLDFLNRDSRQMFGTFSNLNAQQHVDLLTEAINVAVFLCGRYCVVPPGFLVEDGIAAVAVLQRRGEYLDERLIRLSLREETFGDLWAKKDREYAAVKGEYQGVYDEARRRRLDQHGRALISRRARAGAEIAKAWAAGPDESSAWSDVLGTQPAKEVAAASRIPGAILSEGQAVTWPAIRDRLVVLAGRNIGRYRPILQHDYFSVYLREHGLTILRELPFTRQHFIGTDDLYNNYESLRAALSPVDLFKLTGMLSAPSLVSLRARRGYYDFCELLGRVATTATTLRDIAAAFARAASRIPSPRSDLLTRAAARGQLSVRGIDLSDAELDAFDERLQSLAADPDRVIQEMEEGMPAAPPKRAIKAAPVVAVFTALTEERDILVRLWKLKDEHPDPVARGHVGAVDIELICPHAAGRVPAAVETMKYLRSRPTPLKGVVVVGIAGGVSKEQVKLGDVLVAETIVDLALRKIRVDEEGLAQEFRPCVFNIDKRLANFVRSSAFDSSNWAGAVAVELDWPTGLRPTVRYGPIACTDEVVASDEWRDQLLRASPKLQGVEMESGGVCAACDVDKIPVFVVRGVSDLADPTKSDDAWRKRSVLTSAHLLERAFSTLSFVEHL